ncbi:hypothetical protein ACVI1J_005156 [Bradyrhizobium diazoefficiens]
MILLVALYIVVEKSLKNLCYSFDKKSNHYENPKGERFKIAVRKDESNIDAQLRVLRERGFRFELTDEEKALLDEGRKLRNNFAHGDWNEVEGELAALPFRNVLRTISTVFEKIEAGLPLQPQQ